MRIEDYEQHRPRYLAFAQTVADVVTAIVRTAGGYRLQAVRARAKDVPSLRKKLAKDELSESASVEVQIKDRPAAGRSFTPTAMWKGSSARA